MNLHKILKIVVGVLGIIGVVFALMLASGYEAMIDYMLYITYVIMVIILVLVLVYVLKGLASGDIKKTLLSLGIFLGIALGSYIISSGTDLNLQPLIDKGSNITESVSKNIGAGLNMFYALSVFAIGTMLYFGVKKQFNK